MRYIHITLLLLLLSFSSKALAAELPKRVVIKDVPYIKQYSSYCAPASASMVLKYYGAPVDQTTMANLSSKDSAEHQGTNLNDLSNAIRKMGYQTKINFSTHQKKPKSKPKSQKHFVENIIPVINSYIAEKKPVLLYIHKPSQPVGHVIVVIGYDSRKKSIYYMDPAVRRSKIHRLSYKTLSAYTTEKYDKGFYQVFIAIEPPSEKRYPKKQKKKDTKKTNNAKHEHTSHVVKYINQVAKEAKENSTNIEDIIYPSGYITLPENAGKFDFENTDLLQPELSKSKTKASRFAKTHSIKAIENNLLNGNIVVVLTSSIDDKPNQYFILTGYDKSKKVFKTIKEDSTGYIFYRHLLPKLNRKVKYTDDKGKHKKKYSHRIITFKYSKD
nr:hypothetical protein 10 [bacterium]